MKTFKILSLFLLITLASSCDVGDDKELNFGNGAFVAQFPFAEKTGFFLKDEGATYDFSVPIELVGGNGLALAQDITITFEVDETATDAEGNLINTAIEGTNYDFVGSKTLVIPAGSTFASVPLKIYSATLDDQNPPVLLLKLTSAIAEGQTVVTSGNKGSVALTLQGQCTSDLEGGYSLVTTRTSPNGGPYTAPVDFIEELEPGTYNTTFVGQYYAAGNTVGSGAWVLLPAAADAGYTFIEVCGRVKVEDQNLGSVYSNEVRQTDAQYALSTVNPTTGVITINYRIGFSGNTVFRNFRSVYTPN